MKNNTKKTLKIYWQHSRKYKFSVFVMLFSIITASLLGVIVPLYFKNFFDLLTSGQSTDVIYNGLIATLIIIAGIELLQWVFWRISGFSAIHFQTGAIRDLANSCFKYMHKHSFSYFNNNFTGALVKRVSYYLNSFEDLADRVVWEFIPLIIYISIITIILATKSLTLGIALLVWIALFLTVNWIFIKYKMKYDIQKSEAQTEATGFLADTITNNSNVKLFCGYQREVNSYGELNDKVLKIRRFAENLDEKFTSAQTFLMLVLEIGIFYFAIQLWKEGLFTVGDFVLLQSYVLIVIMRVWSFGKSIRRTYQSLADAEEMTEIFNTPHEIKDIPSAENLKVVKGEIKFQGVDFYYHKTRKVLDKFNLSVKPNERIALIGPSGAGKTTVIKLLLRNHEVSGGQISIDGQNISKITQESLWENISLVPQDPILFHRTLMENIRYGKPEASDEEVIKASKLAHCHEFISDLPEKYDTYVGERGIKLSGGERQRVAIARAILRNAPILILDEATSSLDSASESLIQNALDRLMKDKTVIVIAHRLSTIVKSDRIIFVDEGKIIEEGTHQQLLDKEDGRYKKLWKLQAGGFIAD